MNKIRTVALLLLVYLLCNSVNVNGQKTNTSMSDNMIIRISEIGIDSAYLGEYIKILKEESEASVRLEPGVISIYPMFQKENPTEIRILEIYADKAAYESHLQTQHFKIYKTNTMKMVKSLKLVDMKAIDERTTPVIFKKMSQ